MAATRDISVRVRVVGDKEYRAAMKRISAATGSFAKDTALGNLASVALQKALGFVVKQAKEAFKGSVDFESALADVGKTTTMNATQLEYFGQRMKQLSTEIPITATELLNLAEIAGQLGIADEDIQQFTEVMAALGVTTNLSSEQAAESIAKIANIMGTEADEFERFASVVVDLGNNGASTEEEIVNMASRIAGVGKLIGMTESDILGISSALASLGIEADAGGGTISKWLTEMATDVLTASGQLEDFAKVAGMTAGEFRNAWQEDPAQAFNAWVQGLARMEEEGQSALITIGKFGVNEIRMRRVLASLATGNEVLDASLQMANDAWEENVALQEEAGVRYGTSASKLSMFTNQLGNLKVALGDKLKPVTIQTVEELQEIAKAATEAVEGTQSLPKMIADIDSAYNAQDKRVEINKAQVLSLIDSLEGLGDLNDLDSGGTKQYYELLSNLKAIAPDVASRINSTTGAIEGGYGALRAATEEWEKGQKLSLEVAKAEEQVSALEIAEKQLAATTANLSLAQGEYDAYKAREIAIQERMNELWNEARGISEEAANEGRFVDTKALLYGSDDFGEYGKLEDELKTVQANAADAEGTIKELTEVAAESQRQIDEYGATIQTTFENISDASGIAVEGMSKAEQGMIGNFMLLQSRAESLRETYVEAQETIRESLNSIIDGFDEIETPDAKNIGELITGKESQIAYMQEYTKLLEQAQAMGLSGDLLEELADGSTGSFAQLQAIVSGTEEEVTKLKELEYQAKTEADAFAAVLADAQTGYTEKMGEITAEMNTLVSEVNKYPEAYASAAATIQGIIDGVNSLIRPLTSKIGTVKSLIASLANAYRSYTGVWTGAGTAGYTPHAAGLAYVPYDGYPAMLHRGEMVLTALEAKAYRAEQFANYGMLAALERGGAKTTNNTSNSKTFNTSNNSYRFGDIYVRDDRDMRELTGRIAERKRREARGRGAR